MLTRTYSRFRALGLVVLAATSTTVDLLMPSLIHAASPSPAPPGGDPRSSGEGPGFVGDPTTAILLVLAIGLGAAALTALYVRLTRPRRLE